MPSSASTPLARADRFDRLDGGDLFFYYHRGGSCCALLVVDPLEDDEKLVGPFTETYPSEFGPALVGPENRTVVSFGKNYSLRLPCARTGWSLTEPEPGRPCLLVTDSGAIFLRFGFQPRPVPSAARLPACYVDIATGAVHTNANPLRFAKPSGTCAYALQWEMVTNEEEPRVIAAVPGP